MAASRRIVWLNVVTVISAAILIGAVHRTRLIARADARRRNCEKVKEVLPRAN